MATDEARGTIEVEASQDKVLKVLRDVESQTRWVPEIRDAQVLTRNKDGTPATARFKAATAVGTDDYTVSYVHRNDGLSWTLVTGRLQSGQDAGYFLRKLDPRHTEVTFELKITHGLPLPGFVRRRVVRGLVRGTLDGLAHYVQGGSAVA